MQTVSFETAKLAKKKGFTEDCECHYYCKRASKYKEPDAIWENIKDSEGCYSYNSADYSPNAIDAPNQYQLSDWLRELHNLHIEILYDYENDNTSYHYAIRTIGKENGRDWEEDYTTYEECVETALQEALKMI